MSFIFAQKLSWKMVTTPDEEEAPFAAGDVGETGICKGRVLLRPSPGDPFTELLELLTSRSPGTSCAQSGSKRQTGLCLCDTPIQPIATKGTLQTS